MNMKGARAAINAAKEKSTAGLHPVPSAPTQCTHTHTYGVRHIRADRAAGCCEEEVR